MRLRGPREDDLALAARARLARVGRPARRRGGWVPTLPRQGSAEPWPVSAGPEQQDESVRPAAVAAVADRLPLWLRGPGGADPPDVPFREPEVDVGDGAWPGGGDGSDAGAAGAVADGGAVAGGGARARLGLERRQAVVVVLVVLLGLAVAGLLVVLGRPTVVPVDAEVVATGTPMRPAPHPSAADGAGSGEVPADADPATGGSSGPSADGTSGPAAEMPDTVTVHVAGLVGRPGVVELPVGSRVVDALAAAGGADPGVDLTPLNLARVLGDGEQVVVGVDAPPDAAARAAGDDGGSGATVGGGDTGELVDLNSADLGELETLPGIGPALAQRILDWRETNRRFSAVDELREIAGIGEKKFAEIAPLVRI